MKSARKKIEKASIPGYGIYPEYGNDKTTGEYLTQGHWTKTDSDRDKKIKDYTKFIQQGKKQLGVDPVITVDPEMYVKYAQKKEDEMDKENFLSLASLLIDPKNPETQKDAYSVVPELRDIPEAFHKDQIALSMTIHSMLRDGKIRGREDFNLLYYILGPDFQFPMFPLWDPNGTLIEEFSNMDSFKSWISVNKLKNIWNPVTRRYEQNGVKNKYLNNPDVNRKLKLIIAKRMLPALRNLSNEQAMDTLKGILEGHTQSAEFWGGENSKPTDRNYQSFLRN